MYIQVVWNFPKLYLTTLYVSCITESIYVPQKAMISGAVYVVAIGGGAS